MTHLKYIYRHISDIKTWKDNALSIIFYSLIWVIPILVILGIFYKENRALIWAVDGLYQHFPAYNHLCDYAEALKSHTEVSWYNLSIGQGADILTTLNCYDFTDPVSWLTVFITPLSRLARYELMVILKLYLVGISYHVLCRELDNNNGIHIAAGALAYTFCGNILNMLTRHPNFINWAYFLPLMLAGAERIRRKNKPGLLIISVFLNILTNYYTFYMNTVLLVIYVLVTSVCRISVSKEQGRIKAELVNALKLGIFGVAGVMLSMFATLPTVYAFLSNPRVAQKTGYLKSLFHYEPSFYLNLYKNICSFSEVKYLSVTGMNPVALTALILLFVFLFKNRKDPDFGLYWRINLTLLVVMILMLSLPLAGQILNGFSYATNRWSYAVFLFTSVMLTQTLSLPRSLCRRRVVPVFLAILIYILSVALFLNKDNDGMVSAGLIGLAILGTAFLLIFTLDKKYIDLAVLTLTVAGCCMQIHFLYDMSFHGFVSEHTKRDEIYAQMNDDSFEHVLTSDQDFYRTAKTPAIIAQNSEVYTGRKGLSLYWSIIPKWVYEYHYTFQLPDIINPCNYGGLDGRAALMELAGVKYFYIPEDITAPVPYGYKEYVEDGDLYVNEYPLSLGYVYDRYMLREVFDKLNPIDKQEALLSAIVLDKIPERVTAFDPDNKSIDVPWTLDSTDGAELSTGVIKSSRPLGGFTIRATIPDDCEIYLYLDGTKVLSDNTGCTIFATRYLGDKYITQGNAAIHTIASSSIEMRDGITYNLGYGNGGDNKIIINISNDSAIKYDSIHILAVPMDDYPDKVSSLMEKGLKDVETGSDRICGNISLDEPGIMQFSLPYSIGFKAYDNGTEKELIRSDIMYMALPLEEGEHHIELKYHIPFFREGLCVSIITVTIIFLVYIINSRRKR